MSIIQRLKSEIEQFDSEAKDELYRFLEFLRVRNATDPLPVLSATPGVTRPPVAETPGASPVFTPEPVPAHDPAPEPAPAPAAPAADPGTP